MRLQEDGEIDAYEREAGGLRRNREKLERAIGRVRCGTMRLLRRIPFMVMSVEDKEQQRDATRLITMMTSMVPAIARGLHSSSGTPGYISWNKSSSEV